MKRYFFFAQRTEHKKVDSSAHSSRHFTKQFPLQAMQQSAYHYLPQLGQIMPPIFQNSYTSIQVQSDRLLYFAFVYWHFAQ